VALARRHAGAVSIAGVCRSSGFTRQHLARRFEEYVGVPPKLFCRIVRFQSLLARVERMEGVDWSAVAIDSGYYDQAHLIGDFREFTGLPPQAYRSRRKL
jgi:AraC-like DNA-binding protein